MHAHREGLLERLDKLVEAGPITEEEAERLRAAEPGERDDLIREIRLNHAKAKLDSAVEDGRLTQDEADDILGRLTNGERPRFLGGLRPGPARPTSTSTTSAPSRGRGHD